MYEEDLGVSVVPLKLIGVDEVKIITDSRTV